MTAPGADAAAIPPAGAASPGDTPPPGGVAPPDEILEEEEDRRRRRLLLLLLLLLAFIALLGLATWYLLFRQPIPVPTIPGEAIMPTYTTSIYGASRPMSVAVTSDGGRIYIGETAGDVTAGIYDAGGNEVQPLLPPSSTGTDHVPTYLAVSPLTGEIYVSDRPTSSIYIYDAQGTYLRSFTPPVDAENWQPLGLGFDAAGNLYVTDVGKVPNRIRVFDPSGAQIRVFGENDELDFPNGVAIDDAGYAYVTDSNNGRLLVYGQDGIIVARIGRGAGEGNLGLPRGVAIDGQDRVYVADSSGHMVLVYGRYQEGSSRLEYLGSFGSQGSGDGAFAYPNGITVDARGRLYIADSANNRVQLWSY